tara:strand:- start:2757 stop:3491 length:735 start_codon:yes stop_codon:yes gene_type:complete
MTILDEMIKYATDSTRIDDPKTKRDESNYWNISESEIHNLIDKIIYHETGGSNLTTQVQQVNLYGQDDLSTPNYDESQDIIGTQPGYGMGLFQYEKHYDDPKTKGYDQRGGQTAVTRLQNIAKDKTLGINLPQILDNTLDASGNFNKEYQRFVDSGFDFRLLSEEEQKAVFIADKFEHPEAGSNLGIAAGADNVFSDDEIANYWADYHQAGWQTLPKAEQTPYRDKKIKSFEDSLIAYIKSITP